MPLQTYIFLSNRMQVPFDGLPVDKLKRICCLESLNLLFLFIEFDNGWLDRHAGGFVFFSMEQMQKSFQPSLVISR